MLLLLNHLLNVRAYLRKAEFGSLGVIVTRVHTPRFCESIS